MPSHSIRAVGYWRMSTEKQEDSIPRQQSVMRAKAQVEGVDIVQEFTDEAISGGSCSERDGFTALLAYCRQQKEKKKPLQAILCYDPSRFSRATSMETASAIWELQKVGVHKVITSQRTFDFRREEDRAIFLLTQDFTSHKFLKDHAERVRGGKGRAHQAGYFVGGSTPYAFDRLLVDKANQPIQLFRRGERIQFKRAEQRVVLQPIPVDDAEPDRAVQPQTVRWLFETFDREHTSYLALARQLTRRKVPGPGSGMLQRRARDGEPEKRRAQVVPWDWQAVKLILTSPLYAGVYRLGAQPDGQYCRVVNGVTITEIEAGAGREKNPNPALVTLPGASMVPKDLWERVQEKIAQHGQDNPRPRTTRHPYLLSGIVHCGHCGRSMHGATPRCKRADGKGYRSYTRYVCTSADKTGGVACRYYGIREDALVPKLIERIQARYTGAGLQRMQERLVGRVQELHRPDSRELQRLRVRAAHLDGDILQGRKNLLRVRDEVFEELNAELTGWLAERKELQKEIDRFEQLQEQPATLSVEKVHHTLDGLRDLAELLAAGQVPTAEMARVLRLFFHRIRVYFGPTDGKKKGTWFQLEKVEVEHRKVLEDLESISKDCASCKRLRDTPSP